jgi:hypothetical protein
MEELAWKQRFTKNRRLVRNLSKILENDPYSAKNYPKVIDKLNYKGLLTDQNPQKKYSIYNIRGADVIAHVNNSLKLDAFQINSHKLSPKQFVADTTDCIYELTIVRRTITCAPYLIPVP